VCPNDTFFRLDDPGLVVPGINNPHSIWLIGMLDWPINQIEWGYMTWWGSVIDNPESRRKIVSLLLFVDCLHPPIEQWFTRQIVMKKPETHEHGAPLPLTTWNLNFSSSVSPGVCVLDSRSNRTTCRKRTAGDFYVRTNRLRWNFDDLQTCKTKLRHKSIYYIFNSSLRSYIFPAFFYSTFCTGVCDFLWLRLFRIYWLRLFRRFYLFL
jgi:hypothetical protein